MFILIGGENNSGKSRTAEQIAALYDLKRIYIATMIPWGEEGRLRVQRHRRQREKLDFVTVEEKYNVARVDAGGALVLLEDISNLLANHVFGEEKNGAPSVQKQISTLNERAEVLIAVTITGLNHEGCDEPTCHYVDELNGLNAILADTADIVIRMEKGLPLILKGEYPWLG